MDIIKKINKSTNAVYMILPSLSIADLEEIIKLSADSYHNTSKELISDDVYDMLVDKLASLNPKSALLNKTGADIKGKKITLPYWMGSMDKIKTEKALDSWTKNNDGPYLISNKMDGISCLLVMNVGEDPQLYTRGNGSVGRNISYLIGLINVTLPKIKKKLVVRGELIMTIKKFEKYSGEMAHARGMVAGIVTSKEGSIDKKHARDVDFVAYEIIEPKKMSPFDQLEMLSEMFDVAPYEQFKSVDIDVLSDTLKERKATSPYEIDGIIVAVDKPYTRNTDGNPEYSVAYKGTTETANVKVIEVIWKPAKDGHIIPRIHFEKVRLSQANCQYTAGFNAKFINDNMIGPGAVITMTRSGDTIPYIMGVVKQAKKSAMPDMKYRWDKTGVNIILEDADDDKTVIIARMTKFVTDIGVENMSEGTVTKIVNGGYDTIPKIMKLTKDDLLELDGFQDTLAEKLINNLEKALKTLTILQLMVASNYFGRGFGTRKIVKILDVYPDIVQKYEAVDSKKWMKNIVDIDGFDTTTAEAFLNALPDFQVFYKKVSKIVTVKPYKTVAKTGTQFKDQVVVFSFFRDPEWAQYIVSQGGRMASSISKNTTLVVHADTKGQEAKILEAKKMGIKTITRSELKKMIEGK